MATQNAKPSSPKTLRVDLRKQTLSQVESGGTPPEATAVPHHHHLPAPSWARRASLHLQHFLPKIPAIQDLQFSTCSPKRATAMGKGVLALPSPLVLRVCNHAEPCRATAQEPATVQPLARWPPCSWSTPARLWGTALHVGCSAFPLPRAVCRGRPCPAVFRLCLLQPGSRPAEGVKQHTDACQAWR